MKTPLLIDLFDFYGKDIPLQIFGESKKKSLFGAIMGVLSLLSIGAITIYFLITLFSRDTKQIITNKSTTLIPQNDLSRMPFIIGVADAMGIPVHPSAGIFETYAYMISVKWSNYSYAGTEYIPLQLQPCTRADAAGFPVADSLLAVGLCIPYGKYNLTLNSSSSDFTNGWSFINLFLAKCNPSHNKNCQNQTVINNVLEAGYFMANTGAYLVNNDDNTNPMSLTSLGNKVMTSTSLYKVMVSYYVQNLYTDDYGFVFESLVTHNFFAAGSQVTTYSLNAPTGLSGFVGGSQLVATMQLQNSPNVETTKRTFLKAQAILANIGGVMKFIMVIAQVITQFVTRKNVFIQIGNEVFDYRDKRPNVRNEQTLRENNFLEVAGITENVVPIS